MCKVAFDCITTLDNWCVECQLNIHHMYVQRRFERFDTYGLQHCKRKRISTAIRIGGLDIEIDKENSHSFFDDE